MLALLFGARISLGLHFQTLGTVGADISGAFGLDNAQVGLMIGLFMAPGLFLVLPAGLLGRLASDRFLAVGGLALLALGGLLSSVAASSDVLGLGRVLAGVGSLVAMLYLSKMLVDWFDGHEITTAMGIFVMSWPLGIAAGQVGHAWLAELYGWRIPFVAASAWCALSGLAVLALYRAPGGPALGAGGRIMGLLPREWGLVLCAGCAWGMFNAGYVVYTSHGPVLLEAQGMGALGAASVISVGSWLMVLSGAACGQIADRVGQRLVIIAVCMTGAVLALTLLRLPGAGLTASLLFGLVGMAPAGVIMALAGQAVAPERRAFGMGVFYTAYFAIMTASPPLAGWLLDRTGAPDSAIFFGAVLFACVVPAAVVFRTLTNRPATGPVKETA